MNNWLRLAVEVCGNLEKISDVKYLLPSRGCREFLRMLDMHGLGFRRFCWVNPLRLEVAHFVIGDMKKPKRVPILPGEEHQIIPEFVERFPLDGSREKIIVNSWHHELLTEYYTRNGSLDIAETAYYGLQQRLEVLRGRAANDSFARARCHRLIRLCESIKQDGFRYDNLAQYVGVIRTPLVVTRHGMKARNNYYEIVSGYHRTSVAAFLGIQAIRVIELYDRRSKRPTGWEVDRTLVPVKEPGPCTKALPKLADGAAELEEPK